MSQIQNLRCNWCRKNALYEHYHDHEWGQPLYDDQQLFEFLLLEGAQAGLSWITILQKRENYRLAFDNFEAKKIALYSKRGNKNYYKTPELYATSSKLRLLLKMPRPTSQLCKSTEALKITSGSLLVASPYKTIGA